MLNEQQTKALALIRKQQKNAGSSISMMGEQLADICRREPQAAELVAADLEQPELSLKKLAEKFKEYADGHKSGNIAIITPRAAEQLIRDFYSLGDAVAEANTQEDEQQAEPEHNKPIPQAATSKRAPVLSFLDMLATVGGEKEV